MTVPSQEPEVKDNSKEINFNKQRQMYERMLAEKEKELQEVKQLASTKKVEMDEDEDYSEPYVDKKKLSKTLAKFEQQNKQTTQTEIEKAVNKAITEEKRNAWLKTNSDFYEVMQHADKFAEHDPELAESILAMPEGFERQKLVYKNIKALGIHKAPEKQSSIQEKIDANRKSPFYQPSGIGTAPYASSSDYSPTGQKQAYDKMQELKSRLRI